MNDAARSGVVGVVGLVPEARAFRPKDEESIKPDTKLLSKVHVAPVSFPPSFSCQIPPVKAITLSLRKVYLAAT